MFQLKLTSQISEKKKSYKILGNEAFCLILSQKKKVNNKKNLIFPLMKDNATVSKSWKHIRQGMQITHDIK